MSTTGDALRNDLVRTAKAAPQIEGVDYRNRYDFLLREGREFESEALTTDEATFIKSLLKGQRPTVNQCFANSQRLLLIVDESRRIDYVEGYKMVDQTGGYEHGWLALGDKVIDVTDLRDGKLVPVLGEFPDSYAYIGVRIARSYVMDVVSAERAYHSMINHWEKRYPMLRHCTPWRR